MRMAGFYVHRTTDKSYRKVFQMDRFFKANEQWYFATREGIDFGPFTLRRDGEKAVLRYIETQSIMARLRHRDPTICEDKQWDTKAVAKAASEVSRWRLERNTRPDSWYADRADKRK